MSRFAQPHTLPAWLAIATGALAPAAKARLRAELAAHYAEAVRDYREQGFDEYCAKDAALADLGDAHAAARRFRELHLTAAEARQLTNSARVTQAAFIFGPIFVALVAVVTGMSLFVRARGYPLRLDSSASSALLAIALLLLAIISVAMFALIRLRRPVSPKFVVVLQRLRPVKFFAIFGLCLFFFHQRGIHLAGLIIAVLLGYEIRSFLRLRHKLRSVTDADLA